MWPLGNGDIWQNHKWRLTHIHYKAVFKNITTAAGKQRLAVAQEAVVVADVTKQSFLRLVASIPRLPVTEDHIIVYFTFLFHEAWIISQRLSRSLQEI